ncbi:MAG: excinuclease ABC subunit UvrA, partial [Verrucomicrobiota bacterium]
MSRSSIRVVGARQHSLKNLEVEIPHHQLTVITGLSGSGKSSLAFDTLYAEGQRRYVETFSPYTRQFLERMDKPDVDRIDGIPPAIAIEQSNSVRTTRSTVGTMTEIADHLKMLFAHLSRLIVDGREIRPRTTPDIVAELMRDLPGQDVLIGFGVRFEQRPSLRAALESLRQQGFVRVQMGADLLRTDEAAQLNPRKKAPAELTVIQDRIRLGAESQSRLAEAIETALLHGHGRVKAWARGQEETKARVFSNRWHDPLTGQDYEPPKPSLFSYNNPVGACPHCKGFGRIIEIDYHRALPDRNLSIAEGVVKPWQSGVSAECQKDLLKACRKARIPTDVPFAELTEAQQEFVIEGTRDDRSAEEVWEAGDWYGVKGYFDWLESKTYKMHVRVLLSRYRAYHTCPVCKGARFQPQTLLYRLPSESGDGTRLLNLAEINRLPLREALAFLQGVRVPEGDDATAQLKRQATDRLHYLVEVGLGYLTLDRATRTLSGGEIERVNLTSCLGNSLVNTLFVLDEPSIGLHPRDTTQLVRIIEALRDRGNTIVVVEHEEAVMQAADHILDLGPGRGEQGGEIVFAGPYPKLIRHKKSLTGAYLSGRKEVPLPAARRPVKPNYQLRFRGATVHNLDGLDVDIPLGLLVGISGVSGSGKSTLVHDVVYSGLLEAQHKSAEDASTEAEIRELRGAGLVREVIRVDQSPLAKTPRSTPALYLGVYDHIRALFSGTEQALARGLKPGDFSFNAGNGRCTRCGGTGFEKIEMQFLADIFVTCPVCEGKRFLPHVLAIEYRGRNIHDVLSLTAADAIEFFDPEQAGLSEAEQAAHAKIVPPLRLLADIGLGYLKLGQPLNQLSGGEAQRLKLLSFLQATDAKAGDGETPASKRPTRLFILDEPTTGLHFEDIRLLLKLLQRMVDAGDSLLVIEHNLEVLKCADWLLDLGPEAGDRGGELIAAGTPEDIAAHPTSHTGRYLKPKLEPASRNGRLREETPAYAATRRVPSPAAAANGSPNAISIRGARHHNLKGLSLDIALDEMTVLTGLSGSGKSTLAFDLLFAEGQRRYLDSLNAYARQFVEQLEKPDVDAVTGIPPAVAIEQRLTRGGRKSTVATVTEVHQFLRLLYAKLGQAHDPDTGEPAVRQTNAEILERLEKARGRKEMLLLAPLIKGRKGYHTDVAKWAARKGFPELRVDGRHVEPAKFERLERFVEHDIDLVLGNLGPKQSPDERRRMVEAALTYGKGTLYAIDEKGREQVYSTHLYCPGSGRSFDELDPRLFSFNSVHGWCPTCSGYGTVYTVRVEADSEAEREIATEAALEAANPEDLEVETCPDCQGERLNAVARAVRLPRLNRGKRTRTDLTLGEIGRLTIREAAAFFARLKFTGREAAIARDILPEITQRLRFLEEVGLGYLTLDRSATTLSGGESQRIRLAAQLGSNLQGVLYVLDEPTIGLHPRDNAHLLKSLDGLKQKGNTLVVVEHDEDTMRRADRVIDLGPGAGIHGGRVVADGNWQELAQNKKSVTGQILGEPMAHPARGQRRPVDRSTPRLTLKGARANNIRDLEISLPLRRLIGVCGVSGAGKSTLVHDLIRPAAESLRQRQGKKAKGRKSQPWSEVTCEEKFYQVYEVDQSPIGKTSRSTPATYIGLMDELRKLFAQLPLARQRGYTAGRFSFNSGQGRCERCQGQGV